MKITSANRLLEAETLLKTIDFLAGFFGLAGKFCSEFVFIRCNFPKGLPKCYIFSRPCRSSNAGFAAPPITRFCCHQTHFCSWVLGCAVIAVDEGGGHTKNLNTVRLKFLACLHRRLQISRAEIKLLESSEGE